MAANAGTNLSIAVKLLNQAKADLANLDKDLGKLDDTSKKGSGSLGKMGSALGGVAKIAGGFVLAQGILKAPGLFMDAANAAKEDEAATLRLQQAVKNLGGDYDATMDSVNAAIAAGQKLAFTDDQIRDSFQQLAVATGSAEEALSRQKVAMDFARGAGISLEQASKLLGKVNEENVEVFKRMGITIGEGATEAQALAVVQAKFAGQSEAYAKSTAGQFEIAKIKMSEVKETLGASLMPVMARLATLMADTVVPAIERFVKWVGPKIQEAIKWAVDKIPDLIHGLAELLSGFATVVRGVTSGLATMVSAFTTALNGILTIVVAVGQAIYTALQWLNPFAEHSPSLVSQVEKGSAQIAAAYERMGAATENLRNAGGAIETLGDAFGEMTAKVETVANDKVLAALSKIGGAEGVAAYTEAQAAVEALGDSYELLGGQIEIAAAEVEQIGKDLDAAKSAYERFARAAIAESLPFTQAAKDIEYRIAAIQLKINELKQAGGLTMTVGTGDFGKDGIEKTTRALTTSGLAVEDYEKQLASLQLKAEEIKLQEKLKIGPMQDQIEELTDTTEKLTFAEIIAGLKSSKREVDKLTPEFATQSAALTTLKTSYGQIGSQLKTFESQISSVSGEAVRQFDALATAAGGGGGAGGGATAALAGVNTKLAEVTGPGGALEQANTKVNEIKESFDHLKTSLGETKDALDPLTDALKDAAKWFATNKDLLIALAVVAAAYWGAVVLLKGAIVAVTVATWLWVAASAALSAISAALPFVAIGIAIAALVVGIIWLIKNWDDLTEKYPALKAFSDGVVKVFDAIKDAIKLVVDWVVDHWKEIGVALLLALGPIGILVLAVIKFSDDIIGAFKAAVDWVKEHFGEIKDKISEVVGGIKTIITELPAWMMGKGMAMVTGLWEGIQSLAGWIYDKVFAFGKAIFDAVKAGLGKLNPFSPSEYGIEVGYFLGLGIEEGVNRSLPVVVDAVGRLKNAIVSEAESAVVRWQSALTGLAFTGGISFLGGVPGPWDSPGWQPGIGSGGGWGLPPPPIVPVGPPIPLGGPGTFSAANSAGQQQPIRVSVQIDGREIAYAMANQGARSFA